MLVFLSDTLGESRIRDLNDEINKLFREKGHWERRIKELGGANYHSVCFHWFSVWNWLADC